MFWTEKDQLNEEHVLLGDHIAIDKSSWKYVSSYISIFFKKTFLAVYNYIRRCVWEGKKLVASTYKWVMNMSPTFFILKRPVVTEHLWLSPTCPNHEPLPKNVESESECLDFPHCLKKINK